ncbi:malonate decarboxylase holo-[acyl-carrier-protein] synthase [Azospirillum sp. B2RO_4]|uniref:malonate decarboxylase holo-[acyl-carrier-protein] synthase n=1 Tax=Azospirillum sp. B2RO_4 TaxID=3027796 RepID=UPI003DA94B72
MPSDVWPRHGWVRLGENWADCLRSSLGEAEREEVADWCRAGRPLVIARGRSEDGAGELRLGLATPDKRRIGLHVAAEAVAESWGPLPLAEAVETAPEAWRPMLAELVRRALAVGVGPAVYGSLAWQHRTGLGYVRPDSDVDLLFAPRDRRQLDGLLDLLRAFGDGSPRLDGEILMPDGAAVAWRELAGRPDRLLVKGPAEVELRDLPSVLALFDREDAA